MTDSPSLAAEVLPIVGGYLALAFGLGLSVIAVTIVGSAHRHYTTPRTDGRRLPLWGAALVGIVEICIDKPAALHHSRMQAVRRYEARLADARADAMLRHPSNYRARQAAMAHHPSAYGKVVALHGADAS